MPDDSTALAVTFYERVNRPQPFGELLTWACLRACLSRVRPVAGDKAAREEGLPLWSPARLADGTTRANRNVLDVSCLVLDYDDGTDMQSALDRWHGYERMAHTSWSHRPEAPRCRLVMPLLAPVAGAVWGPVIAWVMGMDGQEADAACKDAARQFYLPAVGAGGPHAAVYRPGRWLDLAPVVEVTQRQRAQEEAEAKRRREEAQARIRRQVTDERQRDHEARKALDCDPAARERLGDALGGTRTRRAEGEVVRRVRCPACGRPSVWWWTDPRRWHGAACEHRNSCGWSGRLYDLALLG